MSNHLVPPVESSRIRAGGGSAQARLQSVTGGPGSGITFGYANNASLLESVNYTSSGSTWIGRTMQYDFLNRLKQISTGYGDEHNYQFDTLDRRTKDTLGDGSRWEYAYDQLGQLTNAAKFDVGGASSLNNRFSYTADGIGNVLSAQSPTVGGGEQLTYSFNKQNQLTSVPHSGTTPVIGMVHSNATLTVLAAVNYATTKSRQGQDFRLQVGTGITNVDRYVTLTNLAVLNNGTNADIVSTNVLGRFIPKDASEALLYDLDGNLTNDGRWIYTWDALNRLTGMESQSNAPAASKHKYVFTYDAGGRRIQKEELVWNSATTNYQASITNKFVYNGWDLVAELNGANVALRSYGWLGKSGGLLWIKDHASGEFHVPSFDGNRNVTKLVKYSDRSTSAEYEYAPFGTVLRATGSMALANPIRFSSEYHDDGTGLVYYGYRYYAPHLHRWLSKDPIGYAGGLNLYGFVGNDPVNEVDWFGLARKTLQEVMANGEITLSEAQDLGLSMEEATRILEAFRLGHQIVYPSEVACQTPHNWWDRNMELFNDYHRMKARFPDAKSSDELFELEAARITAAHARMELLRRYNDGRSIKYLQVYLAMLELTTWLAQTPFLVPSAPGGLTTDAVSSMARNAAEEAAAAKSLRMAGFNKYPKERATAEYFEELGFTASKNLMEDVPGAAGRKGDAFINGVKCEFKHLDRNPTPNTIRNQANNSIRRGGQARNIVFDARGTGLTYGDAQAGLVKAWGISREKLDTIWIIGDDYFIVYGLK